MGTSIYLFRASIASLSGWEGFLRFVRLALETLMTIIRGTLMINLTLPPNNNATPFQHLD